MALGGVDFFLDHAAGAGDCQPASFSRNSSRAWLVAWRISASAAAT
jgi:hypothetical protein